MYLKMRYKNYVPHVPQIEVQFQVQLRDHREKSILKISQQSFRMKIRKFCRCKNRGGWGRKLKSKLKYLKTRVFRVFLDENPKIENF